MVKCILCGDFVKDDEISGKMLNESWEVNDDVTAKTKVLKGSLCGQCHCAVVFGMRPTFQSSGEFIEKQGLKRFGQEEHLVCEVAHTWLTFAF